MATREDDPRTTVWSRDGAEAGKATGGSRQCAMEGCRGLRIGVRWPDGKLTWPCTKGTMERPDGSSQIL